MPYSSLQRLVRDIKRKKLLGSFGLSITVHGDAAYPSVTLVQTSRPYPQTDIRRRRSTTHFGHHSPTHASPSYTVATNPNPTADRAGTQTTASHAQTGPSSQQTRTRIYRWSLGRIKAGLIHAMRREGLR